MSVSTYIKVELYDEAVYFPNVQMHIVNLFFSLIALSFEASSSSYIILTMYLIIYLKK